MLVVAAFVIFFSGYPLRADLIANGSFETPVVPAGGFLNFFSGSTLITGWTVVGLEVSIVSESYAAGCCTFPAEAGHQWLDLTGDVSNQVEGVKQTVTTTLGTQYTLSYWVGNVDDPNLGHPFGTQSSVKVLVDGTLIDTATNTTNSTKLSWENFTDTFTATGTTTTIEFLNNDPITDNSNGLDNVTLNATGAVPEPGTIPVLGVILACLGLFHYRRKSIQ